MSAENADSVMTPETAYAAGMFAGALLQAQNYLDLHIDDVRPIADGDRWTNFIELTVNGIPMVISVEPGLRVVDEAGNG